MAHTLCGRATVHQVHAPEIQLTSPTSAYGVWALEDVVRLGPGVNLRGYGHYTETYEKVGGHWLITSSKLTRLREDVFNGLVARCISRPASGRCSSGSQCSQLSETMLQKPADMRNVFDEPSVGLLTRDRCRH